MRGLPTRRVAAAAASHSAKVTDLFPFVSTVPQTELKVLSCTELSYSSSQALCLLSAAGQGATARPAAKHASSLGLQYKLGDPAQCAVSLVESCLWPQTPAWHQHFLLQRMSEALSNQPISTVMHFVARAHVARKLQKPEVALNDLLQARALDPADPLVASNLARLFEDKAAFHNAVQLYTSAIEAVPKEAALWMRRGYVQMKLNKHHLALQDFEHASQLEPSNAEAFASKAAALCALGELQEALLACDMALVQRPGYHKALEHRADVLIQLGRPEPALMLLDNALEDEGAPRGRLLLRRARVLLQLGKQQAGVRDAAAAAQASPRSVFILRGCSGVLERAHDFQGALQLLQQAQKLPGSPANLPDQMRRLTSRANSNVGPIAPGHWKVLSCKDPPSFPSLTRRLHMLSFKHEMSGRCWQGVTLKFGGRCWEAWRAGSLAFAVSSLLGRRAL
ncbi:hypothetical protein WJX74_000200 [Apatococcus lobatus]|uniref:Uncharacterized protein n=1 Tax=Apatococcus lobatus TaxID=904363 RepID=A0AAW1QWR1_9CHLO